MNRFLFFNILKKAFDGTFMISSFKTNHVSDGGFDLLRIHILNELNSIKVYPINDKESGKF